LSFKREVSVYGDTSSMKVISVVLERRPTPLTCSSESEAKMIIFLIGVVRTGSTYFSYLSVPWTVSSISEVGHVVLYLSN
jgi:hypothetical protein